MLWRGFTIIEVSIFLAITGVLFVAVTVGVQNSIFQQRYNDSVQSFVEFLRTIYAETMNVQSANDGNSGTAIYGKLVTFGESEDLAGNRINDGVGRNEVFAYDVIGDAKVDVGTGDLKGLLEKIDATIVVSNGDENHPEVIPAGIIDTFVPKWSSEIQPICKNENDCSESYDVYKGALLIVRHPRSGTVYTFVSNESLNINETIRLSQGFSIGDALEKSNVLKKKEVMDSFKIEAADYCINPNGHEVSGVRTDIRILMGARNSSAIEIIAGSQEEGNKCVRK